MTKITQDVVEKYGGCMKGQNYVLKYIDGADVMDILHNDKVPHSVFHWGMEELGNLTQEEKDEYYKVLEIKNSTNVHYSEKVTDSTIIFYSDNVTNSERIFNSSEVEYSKNISKSQTVISSENVFNSSFIVDTDLCIDSVNVTDSYNILNSNYIMFSDNVVNCTNTKYSHFMYCCTDVTNCYYCTNVHGINHAIFCSNMTDTSDYFVFNKPIDKERYEFMEKMLKKSFSTNWKIFPPMEPLVYSVIPDVNRNVSTYTALDPKFMTWVKSLPGYTDDLFYAVTFNKAIYD